MIEEPSVSGHHAEIRSSDEGFEFIDCNSSNGSWINDQRVSTVGLRSGDRLRLGDVDATYTMDAGCVASSVEGHAPIGVGDVSADESECRDTKQTGCRTASPETTVVRRGRAPKYLKRIAFVVLVTLIAIGYMLWKPKTPERLLKKYLAAKQWQERLEYVFEPSQVEPLMRDHYKNFSGPKKYESLLAPEILSPTTTIIRVAITKDEHGLYWIRLTPDGWKIDWKASVGYNPVSWEAYKSDRPITPCRFRCGVALDDFYFHEFSDRSKWMSVRIQGYHESTGIFGYARRDSEIGNSLRQFLKDGQSHLAIIELRFPNASGTGNCVEITKLVSDGWIEPGAATSKVEVIQTNSPLSQTNGLPPDAATSKVEVIQTNSPLSQTNGLPPDAATDAELDHDLRGVLFMQGAGRVKGIEWGQKYGRVPTKTELWEVLEGLNANRPEEVEKDPKQLRMSRRAIYEFRRGFEEGCKSAIEQGKPAF